MLEYARALDDIARSKLEKPRQLWVLDSQPGPVPNLPSTRDVDRVLETIKSIRLPVPTRESLYAYLSSRGFSMSLTHWLGSNLVGRSAEGPFDWAFNIEGAEQMYKSYKELDCWPILHSPPLGVVINVVRAERSDHWDESIKCMLHDAADNAQVKIHTFL